MTTKFTGLRSNGVRELETEYNRIWEEIQNEVEQRLVVLEGNQADLQDGAMTGVGIKFQKLFNPLSSPVTVPGTYSKTITLFDNDVNVIGFIPIF